MTKTTNYQLSQWEATDKLSRADFNADNAAIDAAIKAVADTANSKAGSAEVSALQQSVNSQIAALSTALGSGGSNCRIAWGSYVGTDKSGSKAAVVLTFPFQPILVYVCKDQNTTSGLFLRPNGACNSAANNVAATWGADSISWYCTSSASAQFNEAATYYYVALGVDE